jgi:hypothetical protein
MGLNDSMVNGLGDLGKNPKADLYALFDATHLRLTNLKEAANRNDSAEAKDAYKDISYFVAKLNENGLWDYLVQLCKDARDGEAI